MLCNIALSKLQLITIYITNNNQKTEEPEKMDENLTMADMEAEISASMKRYHEGDMVKGIIAGIEDYVVYVDVGTYMQGIILPTELSDDPAFSMMDDLKIGEEISAVVIDEEDGRGNLVLSLKKATSILVWDELEEGRENETVYNVKVQSTVKGGWIAYLNGIRGSIPISRMSANRVEDDDKESYVGKNIDVIIADVNKDKNSLILSARELEERKAKEEYDNRVAAITIGTVTKGTVEKITKYGCFVSIGEGISGLVHISQISHQRIKTPYEVVKEGDVVDVKVIDIKDGKISLSMKALVDLMEQTKDEKEGPSEYTSGEEASTTLGNLLAGLKLD